MAIEKSDHTKALSIQTWALELPCVAGKRCTVLVSAEGEQGTVDWGDGTRPEHWQHRAPVSTLTHVYEKAGSYRHTVTITSATRQGQASQTIEVKDGTLPAAVSG